MMNWAKVPGQKNVSFLPSMPPAQPTSLALVAPVASAEQDTGIITGEGWLTIWLSGGAVNPITIIQYAVTGSHTALAAGQWPTILKPDANYGDLTTVYVNPSRRFFKLTAVLANITVRYVVWRD